ncbi:His-Xaa-Ser system protein HxsD [Flavobacterium sp. UBA6046]|jgi:His-Xaa-Ser system protein HxsD|uniref:His-Xaa-Ser system protein HxsD n=1 Tax=Flavobacterium sp. UBA6046 TaxID=1946552 RepID=UPI0025BD7AD8|nr:His-Xaa-Ser system protein HxsD [Flavobacterium sp. UBA6046]
MKFEQSSNGLFVIVDKTIYNIDVLHKCFYWFGANYDVTIEELDLEHYQIEVISKFEEINIEEIKSKIKRDIIDFKLRDIVTKETQTIRDLIIAKAFAYYEEDNSPQTELSDPVGFDPLSI